MTSTKANAKKHSGKSNKKEQTHVIPQAKVAKGRRPHTESMELKSEPYQPSMLSEEEIVGHSEAMEKVVDEVIIEGQPAPKPERTKVDLKHQLENVKGMVQMGTAIMKSSFPKPFEIAEKVVEDWKDDGDFSELPIEQPLLQFYLGLGLRKAKQTEKELEQKLEVAGVLPVFRQQWQKAQKFINKK